MRRQLMTGIGMIIVMTLVCGLAYGLALTGIGEAAFGHQANGSVVEQNGKAVGSSLIGQSFTDADGNPIPKYFQARPSDAVTSSATDNITVSGASNYGPSNPLLIGFVPGVNTVDLAGRQSARTLSPPRPTRSACPCRPARTRRPGGRSDPRPEVRQER